MSVSESVLVCFQSVSMLQMKLINYSGLFRVEVILVTLHWKSDDLPIFPILCTKKYNV